MILTGKRTILSKSKVNISENIRVTLSRQAKVDK